MSNGQSDSPVTKWDRNQLLGRVILDDQLDPFKNEIDRKLAGFARHKNQLLSILFDDYDETRPSISHHEAWLRIEAIAHEYIAREELKHIVNSAAQLDRFRAIANTARRAMDKIEEKRHADLGSPLLKAWLDGNTSLSDAIEEYSNQLHKAIEFGAKIDKTLEALSDLEAAANQAGDEIRRGRGRPDGTSLLPGNYISELKEIYQKSTGKTDDDCFDFIQEFLLALGKERQTINDYPSEASKYQQRKARRKGR